MKAYTYTNANRLNPRWTNSITLQEESDTSQRQHSLQQHSLYNNTPECARAARKASLFIFERLMLKFVADTVLNLITIYCNNMDK